MKNRRACLFLCILLTAVLLSGCGGAETASAAADTPAPTEAPAVTETPAPTAEPTAAPAAADQDEFPPIRAESLRNGVYEISAETDYPLFSPERVELTVEDGRMTAVLHMKSDSFTRLYAGTAAEAAAAGEDGCIAAEPDEAEGRVRFVLPLEALDETRPWAVFGGKQGGWNDCGMRLSADCLPPDAFAEGVLVTPASLGLDDGEYTVNVALRGGSGKAKVHSPARLVVSGGAATAEIVWSSSSYDFMLLGGERILPETTEGGSTFLLPVELFDRPVAVSADTVAMSTPHLIDYTLRFDSASLEKTP